MAQKKKQENDLQIELTDILRIKRAERPGDRFWDEFDRDLHRRMLQTLVKKDPLPVQVFRGLTGRIAQGSALGFAVIVVAVVVLRPVIVSRAVVQPAEMAMAGVGEAADELAPVSRQGVETVFTTEVIKSAEDPAFSKDFESATLLQVASYDFSAYSADKASSRPSIGADQTASLVY